MTQPRSAVRTAHHLTRATNALAVAAGQIAAAREAEPDPARDESYLWLLDTIGTVSAVARIDRTLATSRQPDMDRAAAMDERSAR